MALLSSISPIDKVLPSAGSSPVVVWADDLEFYVAKYGKPHDLFNELVGAAFARIWEIPVPATALIQVNPDHQPAGFSKKQFELPCYGSHYLQYAKDVNELLTTWQEKPHELNKIQNKEDLLKIGLFDIWVSNEDRNHNNTNLLLNPTDAGFQFVAIDHVNLFNSNSLEHGVYHINEFESLISTDYVKMLFKRGTRLTALAEFLEEKFYLYTRKCLRDLPKILRQVPPEWKIDVSAKEELIRKQLGARIWLEETVYHFRLFLENQLTKEN